VAMTSSTDSVVRIRNAAYQLFRSLKNAFIPESFRMFEISANKTKLFSNLSVTERFVLFNT